MKAERDQDMSASGEPESLLDYYNLSHDPFAPRTPGFKFFTPQRKPVLAQLHHLARFGQQVLVVTGPRGSGKTLLRQALVASTNKDAAQCIVTSGREADSASALVAVLCQGAGIGERSIAALLERAEQLQEIGVQLYIVVDDAHLLDAESLQQLADLSQISDKFAPRVFLFAEDVLVGTLVTVDLPEQEQAAWYHRISLQPLSLDETRDYLAQRLEAAGQSIELFSDAQVAWVHEESGGWPGRINEAGKHALEDDMEQPAASGSKRAAMLPVRSLVALVLVSVGVVAAWMMGGDEQSEPTRTVLELPAPEEEPAPALTMDGSAAMPAPAPLDAMEAASDMPEDLVLTETPVQVAEPAVPATDDRGITPGSASSQSAVSAPNAAEASVEPADEVAPLPVPTPASGPATQAATASAPAAAPSARPAATATAEGSAWYRQQAADRYVLQLLGSRSREAAQGFIAAHPALADLHYFETLHEGKPWFVVTQGAYAGRQQAQQAVAQLPEALRKQNPWPRTVASIQQSLR